MVKIMRYDCIIFDFDGTIANTSPGIFNSIKYSSGKLGLRTLSIPEMKLHLGPPMNKAYNRSFGISGQKLDEALRLHKEYSLSIGYREFEFYIDILNVLEKLKKDGYRMGIATTKADPIIKKICKENDLYSFFDVVCGALENETKNDITVRCHRDLSNCKNTLMIGDSVYDQEAADKIGADFIGVTYGYGFSDEDVDSLEMIAESPVEILDRVCGETCI